MAKVKEDDALKKDLIKQFNKEYPDDRLETLGDSELAEIPGWITTGNYALNWIISKNIFHGLPLGRIVLLSGDPASGKCAHEDTKVKIINQNEKEAKSYIKKYNFEETSANLNDMEFDCISFELNNEKYMIPERSKILTKNKGFIFAEDLSENDDIFFVENISE